LIYALIIALFAQNRIHGQKLTHRRITRKSQNY